MMMLELMTVLRLELAFLGKDNSCVLIFRFFNLALVFDILVFSILKDLGVLHALRILDCYFIGFLQTEYGWVSSMYTDGFKGKLLVILDSMAKQ